MWNWNRLVKQIDDLEEKKLDKSDMENLRADLTTRWAQQDVMHRENRLRLDRILLSLTELRRNGTTNSTRT